MQSTDNDELRLLIAANPEFRRAFKELPAINDRIKTAEEIEKMLYLLQAEMETGSVHYQSVKSGVAAQERQEAI